MPLYPKLGSRGPQWVLIELIRQSLSPVVRGEVWRSNCAACNCAQRMRVQATCSNTLSGSIIFLSVHIYVRPSAHLSVHPSVSSSVQFYGCAVVCLSGRTVVRGNFCNYIYALISSLVFQCVAMNLLALTLLMLCNGLLL